MIISHRAFATPYRVDLNKTALQDCSLACMDRHDVQKVIRAVHVVEVHNISLDSAESSKVRAGESPDM